MAVVIIPLISEISTEFLLVNSEKKKVYHIKSIDLILDYLNPISKIKETEFFDFFKSNEITDIYDYTEMYKEFVFDYEFFDYNRDYWREYDNNLMKYYYSYDNDTKQNKNENINLEILKTDSVEILLNILEIVFKPLFEIVKKMEVAYLKTSPSGGYRHPTECILYLKDIEGINDGIYSYSYEEDKLFEPNLDIEINPKSFANNVNIIIVSRVEKAMWRYRETRAYRPILIDLGHILQTLELIVSQNGFKYNIDYNISNFITDADLSLLPFLNLSFNLNSIHKVKKSQEIIKRTEKKSNIFINPYTIISKQDNTITLTTLFPIRKELRIDFESFINIINNNDIDMSLENSLIENNILVDNDSLNKRLKIIDVYITYNWILSLYNYLNIFSLQEKNFINQTSTLNLTNGLVKNLMERRTTRAFSRFLYFSLDKINNFFKNIFTNIQIHSSNNLSVYFTLYNYETKFFDLYSYSIKDSLIEQTNSKNISDKEIANITIGQVWAGSGDLFIWLCSSISENKDYNLSIIDLGRIGQRICLLTTDLGLGVCMTPAVNDSQVCSLLNITASNNVVFYSFNIGTKK